MDAFSYLSVLLSIIVGLAITQVLQGYRGMLLHRAQVVFHAPTLIWSALLLLIATQVWWSSFGLSTLRDWTFGTFAVILLQTVLLYMMSALVLPDFPAGEPVDLAAHYGRERLPFFAAFLGALAASIIKEWLIEGRLPVPVNLAFHGLFATVAVVGAIARRPLLQQLVAYVGAGLVIVYVVLLFGHL